MSTPGLTREQMEAYMACLLNCYPDGCRYKSQRDRWVNGLLNHDQAQHERIEELENALKDFQWKWQALLDLTHWEQKPTLFERVESIKRQVVEAERERDALKARVQELEQALGQK